MKRIAWPCDWPHTSKLRTRTNDDDHSEFVVPGRMTAQSYSSHRWRNSLPNSDDGSRIWRGVLNDNSMVSARHLTGRTAQPQPTRMNEEVSDVVLAVSTVVDQGTLLVIAGSVGKMEEQKRNDRNCRPNHPPKPPPGITPRASDQSVIRGTPSICVAR